MTKGPKPPGPSHPHPPHTHSHPVYWLCTAWQPKTKLLFKVLTIALNSSTSFSRDPGGTKSMVRAVVMGSGCCQGAIKSALALVRVNICAWLIDSRHTFCIEHPEVNPDAHSWALAWRQPWWYAVYLPKSFHLTVTAATVRSSSATQAPTGTSAHLCECVCATDWGLPPVWGRQCVEQRQPHAGGKGVFVLKGSARSLRGAAGANENLSTASDVKDCDGVRLRRRAAAVSEREAWHSKRKSIALCSAARSIIISAEGSGVLCCLPHWAANIVLLRKITHHHRASWALICCSTAGRIHWITSTFLQSFNMNSGNGLFVRRLLPANSGDLFLIEGSSLSVFVSISLMHRSHCAIQKRCNVHWSFLWMRTFWFTE